MNNFSIVIPVYNEELNLKNLVDEILLHLKNYEGRFELIFVNDASTDDSYKVLNKLKGQFPKVIKLINNRINLGQSFTLIEGIKNSKFNTIVTLDADGQNNPIDIPLLLDKYFCDDKLYLVGGLRSKRKDNFIKIISSKIANNIRMIVLKDGCVDSGCSLKVFDKEVFMNFPFFKGIHRFLPALFKGYGFYTYFISVDHRPRIYGVSKYGTIDRLFLGIKDLFKVVKIIKEFKKIRD